MSRFISLSSTNRIFSMISMSFVAGAAGSFYSSLREIARNLHAPGHCCIASRAALHDRADQLQHLALAARALLNNALHSAVQAPMIFLRQILRCNNDYRNALTVIALPQRLHELKPI